MTRPTRADILAELQGQCIEIVGLRSILSKWPASVNPNVDLVRQDVLEALHDRFPTHSKLHKLEHGDYGLFGATWWPQASHERLKVATFLSLWLFVWDDEIDSDVGALSQDFVHAQKYRAETLEYVNFSLGLRDVCPSQLTSNPIIRAFDLVAIPLRKQCCYRQRVRLADEMTFFIQKSEVEQRLRLTGKVMTLSEFQEFRLGTSAVRVVLALNEYCNETDLPDEVIDDPDLQAVLDCTNVNICNVNDLLSVKKEIAQGAAESLLPIIYSDVRSIPAAVTTILDSIEASVVRLDELAGQLQVRYQDRPDVNSALHKLIEGAKQYCTGNLTWSLSTGRYGVFEKASDNIDRLFIQLGRAPVA